MDIENIMMLPKTITSTVNLTDEFRELLSSVDAKNSRSIVYFFMSEKPVPRVRGESRILYIGKTKNSFYKRYFSQSKNLASKLNGEFYKHIIEEFGGLSIGYIVSEDPNATENEYFVRYCKEHLEFPPKSKVG